jgi:hypothetical protein
MTQSADVRGSLRSPCLYVAASILIGACSGTITSSPDSGGIPDSGSAPDSGSIPDSGSVQDGGSIVGSRCKSATCQGSDKFCSESTSGDVPQASSWGVFDNQWSCSGGNACLNETVYVCSESSWYVTSNLPAGNTAVLTYVSSQVNFNLVPLSSFNSVTSTFSEVSPNDATAPSGSSTFGDYEAAYDCFFGSGNANEIMVWVDNNGQTPGGGWNPQATNVTIGGKTFDVYFSGSTTYWVAKTNFTSGTVDLLSIFNYTTSTLKNFSATDSTGYLGQIQFGWELCSTNGVTETFYLDEFSVNGS